MLCLPPITIHLPCMKGSWSNIMPLFLFSCRQLCVLCAETQCKFIPNCSEHVVYTNAYICVLHSTYSGISLGLWLPISSPHCMYINSKNNNDVLYIPYRLKLVIALIMKQLKIISGCRYKMVFE